MRLNSSSASTRGLARWVEAEWLDAMPICDPRAIRSREDMRRLNRLLGSLHTLLAALDPLVKADVFRWMAQPVLPAQMIVLSNLFVYHFEGDALDRLLVAIARKAMAFVCCEPRGSGLALTGSYLLGAIGCNGVTRHDAVVSVRAGFRDQELSARWRELTNGGDAWQLSESAAGLFSHCFCAASPHMMKTQAH